MSIWVQSWEVQGSAARPYMVSVDRNGEYGCSCPAWTKHFPRKDCKHILEIKLRKVREENDQLQTVVKMAAKQSSTGVFGEAQFNKSKPLKKVPEEYGRIPRKFRFED